MSIQDDLKQQTPLQTYQEALDFLNAYFLLPHPKLDQAEQFVRMERFLGQIGLSRLPFHLLHLAGTSGKGSTATILARLLETTGKTVGLSLSPHFVDIRERMQVNGQLIPPQHFIRLLNELLPILRRMEESSVDRISYFGLLTVLAIRWFVEQGVEYAVIETGVGGRFDVTNVLQTKTKIAVLTKIGLDHQAVLGRTLEQIAWQKAGIIPSNGDVFAMEQLPQVLEVFKQEAFMRQAQLIHLQKKNHLEILSLNERGSVIHLTTLSRLWSQLEIGLIGVHQAENVSLALSVFERVIERDGHLLDEAKIREVLKTLAFEGRGEVISYGGKTILFDVAHNPQKMTALCLMVEQLWPQIRPCFVVAFGPTAQVEGMLNAMKSFVGRLVLTDFLVQEGSYHYKFVDLDPLEEIAKQQGYLSLARATSPDQAWERALDSSQGVVIITGSLHFVSVMRSFLMADKIKPVC